MLDWMLGNCNLFGLPCQNWMLVFGAAFAVYLAVALIVQAHQHKVR
jgi:hypothetical protein